MRNTVVVNILEVSHPATTQKQLVAHFCQAHTRPAVERMVEMEVRAGQVQYMVAPDKLQGCDFNLVFPLSTTKEVSKVDFAEIEAILVLNKVAHNVTSIEPFNDSGDWLVTYNEFVKAAI